MYQRISVLLMIAFNCSSFIQMGAVAVHVHHQSSGHFCQLRGWYECEGFFSLLFLSFVLFYIFYYPISNFFCHLFALQ